MSSEKTNHGKFPIMPYDELRKKQSDDHVLLTQTISRVSALQKENSELKKKIRSLEKHRVPVLKKQETIQHDI